VSVQPSMVGVNTDGTCTAKVICSALGQKAMQHIYLSDEDVLKSRRVDSRELRP